MSTGEPRLLSMRTPSSSSELRENAGLAVTKPCGQDLETNRASCSRISDQSVITPQEPPRDPNGLSTRHGISRPHYPSKVALKFPCFDMRASTVPDACGRHEALASVGKSVPIVADAGFDTARGAASWLCLMRCGTAPKEKCEATFTVATCSISSYATVQLCPLVSTSIMHIMARVGDRKSVV